MGSFRDGEKPSMEIDLDFYDDELVETIDDDIKVIIKNRLNLLICCSIEQILEFWCNFLNENLMLCKMTWYSKTNFQKAHFT